MLQAWSDVLSVGTVREVLGTVLVLKVFCALVMIGAGLLVLEVLLPSFSLLTSPFLSV